MAEDPLASSVMIGAAKTEPLESRSAPPRPQHDFQAELQSSADPNQVLAGWCIQGRPRVTAALADEGSILKLAAQLLCETTYKSFGASATEKHSVELVMLKAAFSHKIGHSKEAALEFRNVAFSPDTPSCWRRRAFAALGWVLAATGDQRACVQSSVIDGMAESSFLDDIDKFALLIASVRIRCEIGDAIGARQDFEKAKRDYSKFTAIPSDCRVNLAEARLHFAEGDLDTAARLWHSQTSSRSPSLMFPTSPEESVSSWLAAFAIGAVVGDLGDFIIEGSRAARHEAANNFAVCALHAGRLDGAVTALEEVLKSFGAPTVMDSVAASNLKTLYELRRTPDALRLIS